MKKSKFLRYLITLGVLVTLNSKPGNVFAQCLPTIIIDGNSTIADEDHPWGIRYPYWLSAGQTLNIGYGVQSISVIEFSVNGSTLDYSQTLSITTNSTVPAGKTWKIESVVKDPGALNAYLSQTFNSSGTYIVPCTGIFKIRVWGGGGGGGGDGGPCLGSAGGGGGGYAEGNYFLVEGTSYPVTVGAGGAGGAAGNNNGSAGGTSSFGSLISATGGGGGQCYACGSNPGAGGTGNGQVNYSGQSGSGGGPGYSGKGGDAGGGGGAGGPARSGCGNGYPGTAPGGGGSGGSNYYVSGGSCYSCSSSSYAGGAGAPGRVVVSSAASSSAPTRGCCTTLYLYGTSCSSIPSCPIGWSDAGCGVIYMGSGGSAYCRTCYRCD